MRFVLYGFFAFGSIGAARAVGAMVGLWIRRLSDEVSR